VNILQGVAVPIYGDGRNRRDWLHVEDHCRGIELVLRSGSPGEVYNIGGGSECDNLEIVRTLCGLADERFGIQPELRSRYPNCPAAYGLSAVSLIKMVADRPGHDRRYAIDCRKIQRDLGYKASVSLEAGLRRTFNWYVQNDWWWRSAMDSRYREWIRSQYSQASVELPATPLNLPERRLRDLT
jgi:dTDP-glucose 4,6-dehydratase